MARHDPHHQWTLRYQVEAELRLEMIQVYVDAVAYREGARYAAIDDVKYECNESAKGSPMEVLEEAQTR